MKSRQLVWLLLVVLLALVATFVVWRGSNLAPETARTAALPQPHSGHGLPPRASSPVGGPAAGWPMANEEPASAPSMAASAADQASPAWLTAPPLPASGSQPAAGAEASVAQSNKAERAVRRAEIQALLKAYQAKGPNATLADSQQMLAQLQTITAGRPSAGFVALARESVAYAAQAQVLAQELQRLQPIVSAEGTARQQAILVELRTISQRMSVLSANAQQAAADIQTKGRP